DGRDPGPDNCDTARGLGFWSRQRGRAMFAIMVERGDVETPEVPGYEVSGLIGRGAMATVWRARERTTDREVALKWISFTVPKEERARFQREARGLARARHPNI